MSQSSLQDTLGHRRSDVSLPSVVSRGSNLTSSDSDVDDQRQYQQNNNVRFGPFALQNAPANSECVGMGFECLKNCVVHESTGLGHRALYSLTTAQGCTGFGYYALANATQKGISDDCTAFGNRAAMDTNANGNSAFGASALMFNVSGLENSGFGAYTGANNINGSRNSYFGYHAGYGLFEGDDNTIFGHTAQRAVTSVYRVTVFGSGTGTDNHAHDLTAFGYHAAHSNQNGEHNVALGPYCLENNVSGSGNTGAGWGAMRSVWGNDNTIFGNMGMTKGASTASENSGFGSHVLENCIGSRNTATGFKTLMLCQLGHHNTGDGYMALCRLVGGSKNACVGASSGTAIVEGCANTALGFQAGPATDLEDTISLGTGARPTQNGELAIASAQHPVLTAKQVGEAGDATKMPEAPHMYLAVTVNSERFMVPLFKPFSTN